MSTKCRVGMLAQALLGPRTGIGRYASDLADAIHHQDEFSLSLVGDLGHRQDWPTYARSVAEAPKLSGLHRAISSLRASAARIPLLSLAHLQLQANVLARVVTEKHFDVFHGPNFFAPPMRVPRVVTIHDLSTLDGPEWHPRARVARTNRAIELSLDSEMILSISEFTKKRIMERFGVSANRIMVSHLYPSAIFKPCAEPSPEASEILTKNKLTPGAYCLCTSTIEPRKNLERLILAYKSLPDSLRHSKPLVLVGAYGWKSRKTLAMIEDAVAEGWLRYARHIADRELVALLQQAGFVAYPSLYEGFGLPVVEALACGLRVVVADTEISREIAGEGAGYFNPTSISQLRHALESAFYEVDTHGRISADSIARSQRFKKSLCLQKTCEAYAQARFN